MSIKVNFHNSKGIAKSIVIKAAKSINETIVVTRPEKGIWIEFVEEQTGIAPKKIFTKRQGDDLLIFFDDQTETAPEFVIENYYNGDELAPILGKDADSTFYKYLSELSQPELNIAELSNDVLAAQVISKETFTFAVSPAWWTLGGLLSALGLFTATRGSKKTAQVKIDSSKQTENALTPTDNNPTENTVDNSNTGFAPSFGYPQSVPPSFSFDKKAPYDGSVSFNLKNADSAKVTYTPTNTNQPKTVEIKKVNGQYVSNDPDVIIDSNGNVSIAADKVADNTKVTATTTKNGLTSKTETFISGEDKLNVLNDATTAKKGDGSVSFKLTEPAEIKYVPTGSDKAVTAKIEKDANGKYISNDPNIEVNPHTGEVFIAEDKIQDNSQVSVIAQDQQGNQSKEQTVTAGSDHLENTNANKPNVLSMTDKSSPLDDNPESLVVSGKTEPFADVEVKDKNGNVVGKGKADDTGAYTITVTEKDNKENDIDAGDFLDVITKVDGKNPTTEKITVPTASEVPVNHTGDKVGPQTPPQIENVVDNNAKVVKFPQDNDAKTLEIEVTPKGNDKPMGIELTKDSEGNLIGAKVEMPNGVTVEVKQGEDGTPVLEAKNEQGHTVDVPSSVQVNDGKVTIDTDGNPSTRPIEIETAGENAGNVTIPDESIEENTGIDVTAKDKAGNPSDTVSTVSTEEPKQPTTLTTVKVTSLNDTSPAKDEITKLVAEGNTEPNAKVKIKQGDVVIAETVADESGYFRVEFNTPAKAGDELTVVAQAPNKSPSEAKTTEVPTLDIKTGLVGDSLPPAAPTVTVGKDGANEIKITPKDPQPGDSYTIGVIGNDGTPVTLVVNVDKEGKLVPADNNPALTINQDGTIQIDRTAVKDNTPITVVAKDLAGNISDPTIAPTSRFDKVTDNPEITSITAKDSSAEKGGNPDTFTIEGTAPAGSTVIAKDKEGNEIGRAVADQDGNYTIEAKENGSDIQAGDPITVTAQRLDDNGNPVEGASSIPALVHIEALPQENTTKPTAPAISQKGSSAEVQLPEDAKEVVIAKDENGDGVISDEETTILQKDDQGTWTVKDGKNPNSIAIDGNTATIPSVKEGDVISATGKDAEGNSSTTTQATIRQPDAPQEKTAQPTEVVIDVVDTSEPATVADKIIVTGKVDAPDGTEITVKQGDKIVGTGIVNNGTFKVVISNDDGAIKANDVLSVTAHDKAGDKAPSDTGTAVGNNGEATVPTVPALEPTLEDHPNAKVPSAPTLVPVAGTGAVAVLFPKDAEEGDQVEVRFTKEGGNKEGENTEETVVIFTKDKDGNWISGKPEELPSVKDNLSNPTLIIPEEKIEGSVNAKSIDAVIKGEEGENPAQPVSAGDNAKTAQPTGLSVSAKDASAQADGSIDQITVSGKAEAGSLVTVYKDGTPIKSVQLDEGVTDFSIPVDASFSPEENITVVAKHPSKTASDSATATVPAAADITFADQTSPANPTVEAGSTKGDGSVTVKLPEANPAQPFVKGDKLEVTYTPTGTTEQKTAVLTYDGQGNWISNDEKVPSITQGKDSTTIEEATLADRSNVSAVLKDVAGNVSTQPGQEPPKAQAKEDKVTDKPTALIIKAEDTAPQADGNIDQITVSGKAEAGSLVTLYKGEQKLGEVQLEADQTDFTLTVPKNTANNLSANDTISVEAQHPTKAVSDKAESKIPTEVTFTNDKTPPANPAVTASDVKGDGSVTVKLPEANPQQPFVKGDKLEVTYTPAGTTEPKTAVLTYDGQGNWNTNDDKVPSITQDKNSTTILEGNLRDGSTVSAVLKDVAGNVSTQPGQEAPYDRAKEDEITATPTELIIKAEDTAQQADGNIDQITVSGKAEAGSLVTLYKGNEKLGEVQLEPNQTDFTFTIPKTKGNLSANDTISVEAKHPTKAVSDKAESQIPTEVTFTNDKTPLASPSVTASATDGSVTVTLPQADNNNPFVKGDKLEVTYFPNDEVESKTAVLTYNGDGKWASESEPDVPSILKGQTSMVIPEDTLHDGSVVKAVLKDVASNLSSETDNSKANAGQDAKSPTPTNVTIASYDKDTSANATPEKVVIKGDHPVPNAIIEVKNSQGQVIAKGKVNDQGKFEITLEEGTQASMDPETGNNVVPSINSNDTYTLVATETGKKPSQPTEAVTVTDVPTGEGTGEFHTEDRANPQAPTISTATNTPNDEDIDGSVTVTFPPTTGENPAVVGDKVSVTFTPQDSETPVTITYTLGENNTWTQTAGETPVIPVTTESGKPAIVLPEKQVKDGYRVEAKTIDQAGKSSTPATLEKAPFDEKSAKPTISSIKAIDVVGTNEVANDEPEKAIVTVTTNAPQGSVVKVYKEGELSAPIGEGVVGANSEAVITLVQGTNPAPTDIKATDKFVATVTEAGKAESPSSNAVEVGKPALGKYNPNNPAEQAGGHEGDNTPPTTAPTLTAEQSGEKRGAVTVTLPGDAQVGDRVVLEFTSENPEQKVFVTLTKGSDNNWTSDKTGVVANPTGNSAEIPANQVKDNSPVKVKIVDLADNEKEGEGVTTAFDDVTPLSNVSLTKAISTESNYSDNIPEQFTLTGTSEKGATVKAYVTHNGQEVEIGSSIVTEDNGTFTLTTTSLPEGFKVVVDGTKTAITLKAENVGNKAISEAQTVTVTEAARGSATDQSAHSSDKTQPEYSPTVTPRIDTFGGAKIELPKVENEKWLEVKVKYAKPGETNNNASGELTLIWNGTNWTSSDTEISVKPKQGAEGVFVVDIPYTKVQDETNLTVSVTDYAGNTTLKDPVELNKGPTDDTANDTTAPERTDVPTITAGRTEAVNGVSGDQPNAGDIVAKPGGDNDRMVVKYIDNDGNAKEIAVKKDLEQGKWVVDDAAQPTSPATKADQNDYILQDDGTVIVKGPKVKDNSQAEAIGYKGEEKIPSDKPYNNGYTVTGENGNPVLITDRALIRTNKDDATPDQTDPPKVTKGETGSLEQGSAKIKAGDDNVEVIVKYYGYVKTTNTDGVVSKQVTTAPEGENGVTVEKVALVAKKDEDGWKLYVATLDGQNKPQNLVEASSDIGSVDKDGNILLEAAAVKDNTQVSATGFNAMKLPAEGKTDTDNVIVEGGLTAQEVEDKLIYPPRISQLSNGNVSVTPGDDNTTLKVTYDKGDNSQGTIELVKVEDPAAPETVSPKPMIWKVKGNENAQLPDGATFDPQTGIVTIPKAALKVGGKVNAESTDAQNNKAQADEHTVLADATPDSAGTVETGMKGDQPTFTPPNDAKKVDFETDGESPTTIGSIEKKEDGTWDWVGNRPDGVELDKQTGVVTFPSGGGSAVPEGKGIVTVATDISGNTSAPTDPVIPPKADTSRSTAGTPTVAAINEGDNKGGVSIKPGVVNGETASDNIRIEVSYVKEKATDPKPENPESLPQDASIVAVKDNGVWSLPGVSEDVATINPTSGEITLKASEVMDGSTVKAKGSDVLNNQAEGEGVAPNNPDVVSEAEQPVPPIIDTTPPAAPATETPTLFENVKPGEVKITAGQGVDYINFKVQVDTREVGSVGTSEQNSYLNYVLVKNEAGTGWDQFVYRITDTNKNGSIDEGADSFVDVTNDPNTMKLDMTDSSSGVFVLKEKQFMSGNADMRTRLGAMLGDKVNKNDKTDKIFDIVIGREGSETIELPNTNGRRDKTVLSTKGAIEDFTLISAGHFDTSTDTSSNFTKAPKYHHVLSNGEDITSPVFKVTKVGNSTEIEVLVDKDLNAVGFELSSFRNRYEWKRHYLTNNNGTWEDSTSYYEGDGLITRKTELDSETKVGFIIKAADGINLSVDDPYLPETGGDVEHRLLKNIVYGAKKGSNTGEIPKYYPVDGDPDINESGSNGIKLANIDLKYPDVVVAQPTPAPKPVEPAGSQPVVVENIGKPTAVQDGQNQGGVKVKPASGNGDQTNAFQVDYRDAATNTNRTIWFKKQNGSWQVDTSKYPDQNHVNVSTNGTGDIKLDTVSGEVTFAPKVLKDGSNVTITSLDSNNKARNNATVTAAQEPQPAKPEAKIDTANQGGVYVMPKANTNKFKLAYTDENGQQRELIYEKEGNNWKLSNTSKALYDQIPQELKPELEASTGKVTLKPNAVLDSSQVSITTFNNEGFASASSDVKAERDVVFNPFTDGIQTETGSGKRIGYNSEGWLIKRSGDTYMNWSNEMEAPLKNQLLTGKDRDGNTSGNTIPSYVKDYYFGKEFVWGNGNDYVAIEHALGKFNDQSGKNAVTRFNFGAGSDALAIGNDLGTSQYRVGDTHGQRFVIQTEMGDGNDLLVVGTDNDKYDVYRNTVTGEIDSFLQNSNPGSQWVALPKGFNPVDGGGGRVEKALISMGNGDDAVVVQGITGQNWAAVKESEIYLGDGDNRFIISQNGTHAYNALGLMPKMIDRGAIEGSKVVGGRGSDYVKTPTVIGNSEIALNDGNDIFITNRFLNSKVNMGAGNDIVEIREYSMDDNGNLINGMADMWVDTEIGVGTNIDLGAGNDIFYQGDRDMASDAIIKGGSGIDLYRIAGSSNASTANVKGFERIELVDGGAVIGVRYGDLKTSGLEGPMKIHKGFKVDGNDKVKVDLGRNNADWLAPNPSPNLTDGSGGNHSNARWDKASSPIVENGYTYDIYTINGDSRYSVWIERGIEVI